MTDLEKEKLWAVLRMLLDANHLTPLGSREILRVMGMGDMK